MQEKNNQLILESLNRLKTNNDYQLIKNELEQVMKTLEQMIFDENQNHELKEKVILKRKLISLFIELPNDLLTVFSINEK